MLTSSCPQQSCNKRKARTLLETHATGTEVYRQVSATEMVQQKASIYLKAMLVNPLQLLSASQQNAEFAQVKGHSRCFSVCQIWNWAVMRSDIHANTNPRELISKSDTVAIPTPTEETKRLHTTGHLQMRWTPCNRSMQITVGIMRSLKIWQKPTLFASTLELLDNTVSTVRVATFHLSTGGKCRGSK